MITRNRHSFIWALAASAVGVAALAFGLGTVVDQDPEFTKQGPATWGLDK